MSDQTGSITFVPSVHYSDEHCRRVTETIQEEEPDVVAVELGQRRFQRMDRGEEADPFEVAKELPGAAGKAYLAFSAIQKTIVRFQGMNPEDTDMKAAIREASVSDTPVALIDDPMTETFSNLFDQVSLSDIPEMLARQQDIDQDKIEEMQEAQQEMLNNRGAIDSGDDIQPMIDNMREFAPEIVDVMIDQRDRSMAERLHKIRENGHDAVAVIGAGHHNGILEHLDRLDENDEYPDTEVPIRESEMQVTRVQIN